MKSILKAALVAVGLTTFVAPAFADFGIKGITDKAKAEVNKSKDDAAKNGKKTAAQMKGDAKDGANKEKADAKTQAKDAQKQTQKDAKLKANDIGKRAVDNITEGGDGKGTGSK